MYEFTDTEMKVLTRRMVQAFSKLKKKSILAFDNMNALKKAVDDCYKECLESILVSYTRIAQHYCKEACGDDEIIDLIWIEHFLGGLDPVTKYIFTTEADRTRARAFESIAVSRDVSEVDTALKLYHRQVKQWADNITDAATLEGYMEAGIKEVKWKTEEDARVCKECGERNDVVYPIKSVPDKPHPNCRCYLLPVRP